MTAPAELVARLHDLVGSSWRTQAVHAMVSLRLADVLSAAPLSSQALATEAGVDGDALRRLLRGLVLLDLVAECDGCFTLTEMGRLLRTQSTEGSLAQWVTWWADHLWASWGLLSEAVRTGAPMREQASGRTGYGYQAADPAAAETFHRAMAELSGWVAPHVMDALDGIPCDQVVDVGGGHGELLVHLLRVWVEARATLLEQPHAVEGARKHLEAAGLGARCEIMSGDFFQFVPSGADCYLLKSVLHNWGDQQAIEILRRCAEAMTPTSRLVVIERLLDEPRPSEAQIRTDLNMLVGLGGRERTLNHLLKLGFGSGLRVHDCRRTAGHCILVLRLDVRRAGSKIHEALGVMTGTEAQTTMTSNGPTQWPDAHSEAVDAAAAIYTINTGHCVALADPPCMEGPLPKRSAVGSRRKAAGEPAIAGWKSS